MQVCQFFIQTCSKSRKNKLIGHKKRESFSIKLKLALHIMSYIVMLAWDRWYKICQSVQKSADNKLTPTITNGRRCLSTFSTQHFLHSFATFLLFVMWGYKGIKIKLILDRESYFFFSEKCMGVLKLTVDQAELCCYRVNMWQHPT